MKDTLTRQEWIIMEALWAKQPMFLSEIMEAMRHAVDWKKSTYSTYLRKMCEKGYLDYKTISGNRCYFSLMNREECAENESRSMLSKLTGDAARLFLTCMIKEGGLSETDREELRALIAGLSSGEEK